MRKVEKNMYKTNNSFFNKIYFYLTGLWGLKNEDIILTSFPKSGNTWVRFFFCNLISLIYWNGELVDFKLLDETMPELGVSNLLKSWPYDHFPRIVKTHKSYVPFFRNKKTILIVRDPRDTMVSYYYYATKKKTIDFSGSFSQFIWHRKLGLESWFSYHKSWESVNTKLFRYEDLKADEYTEFSKMLNFLGLSFPESIVLKAINLSSFDRVKQNEQNNKDYKMIENKNGFSFARKGLTGEWINYFSEQDICYYNQLVDKYRLSDFYYN